MGQDQAGVGYGCESGRPRSRARSQPAQSQEDKRVEGESDELAQRIAPHVNVDQVKRSVGVCSRSQHGRWPAIEDVVGQQIHAGSRAEEPQDLSQLDGVDDAQAGQVKSGGDVESQGCVVVPEGIAEPEGRVGHPTGREVAALQRHPHLVHPLQEKRAVPAGAGAHQPWVKEQGEPGGQG